MFVFYDWPFPHMYFAESVASIIFPLILGSVSATASSFMGITFSSLYQCLADRNR